MIKRHATTTLRKATPSKVRSLHLVGVLVLLAFLVELFVSLHHQGGTSASRNEIISRRASIEPMQQRKSHVPPPRKTTTNPGKHDGGDATSVAQRSTDTRQDTPPTTTSSMLLPQWIQEYFAWHRGMRHKYPGTKLLTDPSAPNVILRTCLGLCGGLNDRLGQLPWDLYLANQTNRVYLIRWERPKPLEHFLQPNNNGMDWTVPPDMEGLGDMHAVRALPNLFEGYLEDRPEAEFWETQLDAAIQRANTGEYRDKKILRHRLLGHLNEEVLEARLRALGETDMIHNTPSFGSIFHALFQPSTGVQEQLDAVYKGLQLIPHEYSAVHCRVRHPKATASNVFVKGKNDHYPADKTGLPFHGDNKDFAVSIATHAIQCARTLSQSPDEAIYFFSDSNDLAQYLAHDLVNPSFVATNNAMLYANKYDYAALEVVRRSHVVSREQSMENAHIDRQKGRDPPAYFATFVDLFLAINARCVTYGIGFYAIFATKISGISCKLLYQEEEWGGKGGGKGAPLCTEAMYEHLLIK